jgi:hypothetical protein
MALSGVVEFPFYNSYDANVEVQCEVLRLELPLASQPEGGCMRRPCCARALHGVQAGPPGGWVGRG